MNPSPSGLSAVPSAGYKDPTATPRAMANNTCTYKMPYQWRFVFIGSSDSPYLTTQSTRIPRKSLACGPAKKRILYLFLHVLVAVANGQSERTTSTALENR